MGGSVKVVGEIALDAASNGINGVVIRAHTVHPNIVVDFAIGAWGAPMRGGIVVLVVGADGAVLAIVVRVDGRTVLALPIEDVVDLLFRTKLAFQIPEVPVLGVFASDAHFQVPKHILSLVADTFLHSIVVHAPTSAVLAHPTFFVLGLGAKRATAVS